MNSPKNIDHSSSLKRYVSLSEKQSYNSLLGPQYVTKKSTGNLFTKLASSNFDFLLNSNTNTKSDQYF